MDNNHDSEKISVIIPCCPSDIDKLPRMLDSLAVSTYLPDEVIVCLSETDTATGAFYGEKIGKKYEFPVIFHLTEKRQFAGQNRNRGAGIAKYGILVFCDADDVCHPQKIEITKKIFLKYHPKIFLHNFLRKSEDFARYDADRLPLIFADELCYYTFGDPPRRNNSEWIFIDRPAEPKPVEGHHPHHGYAAVDRQVFSAIKYRATKIAEDTEFCLDVLWKYRDAVYADIGLVNYIKDL